MKTPINNVYLLEDYHPYHWHSDAQSLPTPAVEISIKKQEAEDSDSEIKLKVKKTAKKKALKSNTTNNDEKQSIEFQYWKEYDILIGSLIGYDNTINPSD